MTDIFRLTLGIQCNERDEVEVYCVGGDDGPDDVALTFESLIDNWIAGEAVDGELHPYLDDSLDMLMALNRAQIEIAYHLIAQDDPAHADLRRVLNTTRVLLERLIEAARES